MWITKLRVTIFNMQEDRFLPRFKAESDMLWVLEPKDFDSSIILLVEFWRIIVLFPIYLGVWCHYRYMLMVSLGDM